ncbi:hypothetical protein C8F04DRAFT_1321713, partial [Mycena alexandri]
SLGDHHIFFSESPHYPLQCLFLTSSLLQWDLTPYMPRYKHEPDTKGCRVSGQLVKKVTAGVFRWCSYETSEGAWRRRTSYASVAHVPGVLVKTTCLMLNLHITTLGHGYASHELWTISRCTALEGSTRGFFLSHGWCTALPIVMRASRERCLFLLSTFESFEEECRHSYTHTSARFCAGERFRYALDSETLFPDEAVVVVGPRGERAERTREVGVRARAGDDAWAGCSERERGADDLGANTGVVRGGWSCCIEVLTLASLEPSLVNAARRVVLPVRSALPVNERRCAGQEVSTILIGHTINSTCRLGTCHIGLLITQTKHVLTHRPPPATCPA